MKRCHPLLSRERREFRKYSHGFSSSQIHVLDSICEILIPPLQLCDVSDGDLPNQAFNYFYKSSGPDEVAELLAKRVKPKAQFVVSLVLKLLSTRLGTLLLWACLFRLEVAIRSQIYRIVLEEQINYPSKMVKSNFSASSENSLLIA